MSKDIFCSKCKRKIDKILEPYFTFKYKIFNAKRYSKKTFCIHCDTTTYEFLKENWNSYANNLRVYKTWYNLNSIKSKIFMEI